MMNKIFACIFLLLHPFVLAYAQSDSSEEDVKKVLNVQFYTKKIKTGVAFNISRTALTYYVIHEINDKIVTVKLPETPDATAIFLVDDFDFNGNFDFAIASLDTDKGVYIYRVFLYSKEKKSYIEQQAACGDGVFFDLKFDIKSKQLLSTYYQDNAPQTCVTKLKPIK